MDSSKSNLDPDAPAFNKRSPDQAESKNNSVQGRDNEGANDVKNVPGVCPVQKIRVRDSEGNLKTLIAMLDTGSNTSLLSKRAAKLLGLSGPQTHVTMNLAGGQQRGAVSEVLEIVIESPVDEDIRENLQVHTVRKPCSSAKTVSRKTVEAYPHLKTIADKLYLSGGTVDLLIGTDFVDAFVDIH